MKGRDRISYRHSARIAAFVALLLAAPVPMPSAVAQSKPGTVSEKARKQAAVHYRRGAKAFKDGLFDEALEQYQKAYELAPAPLLMFNIGLAYRAQGDTTAALTSFRAFLGQQPKGTISDEAREYVRELEVRLQRERRARETRDAARRERERERTQRERLAAMRVRDDRRADARAGRTQRVTGLVLVGAGLALSTTGLFFGLSARSISGELSEHQGPWTDEVLARVDDGERAQRNMLVTSILGGTVMVAGGVLYILGRRARARRTGRGAQDERTSALRIAPSFSRQQVGLFIQGRF